MLWNAFADRYNGHGLAQTKGEAVIKRASRGNLVRIRVSLFVFNGGMKSTGHGVMNDRSLVEDQAARTNGPAVNDDRYYQLNGKKRTAEVDGNNTTLKEHDERCGKSEIA